MLEIEAREIGGTSTARAVRRTGKIPGVLYGNGRDPYVFAVESRHLRETLSAAGGRHAVIEVKVPGTGTPIHAVIKDIQLHPLRDTMTHFDLLEVRMDRTIQATVSIVFTGEAEGVKTYGGILAQNAHELTIEALPGDLPEHVEIDISELGIGDSIKLSDLPEVKGLTYIGDPETMLASVAQPKGPTAEEEAAEAEAEAASEAAEARAEAGESDGEDDSGSDSGSE
jgi:large subunit ribosomal protein L25